MAMQTDQTYYPALLGCATCEEEKGMLGEPLLTQEKHFEVGGPVWVGIYCFVTHLVIIFFVSSISHVPFVGESPAWLQAAILVDGIVTSFVDQLGAYMVQPGKIQTLVDAVLFPLRLPGQIFFIAELYTVCPVWKANALVSMMLVILVGPSAIYKKVTAKEAPSALGLASLCTLHLIRV